jgi:hypothetical protein
MSVRGDDHPGYPPLGPGAGPHNPFPDLHGSTEDPGQATLRQRLESPTCLYCGHRVFQEEIAKLPTRFGWEAHKSKLLICARCGFMMNFSLGRGINFD